MMSRRWTTLAVTSLAFAMVAQAQSSDTTGAIRGRVSTVKGAAIVGGVVSIRNLDTGLSRSAQTNADGTFTVGLLPTGDYQVTIKAAGQKTLEDKVHVSLGDAASRAYHLEDETAGTTVEIVGAAQTLDPAQVNVVSTVDEKLVTKIPLVNRNFLDLVRLTPGAVAGPGNPPRLMVQGARQIMNNLQIDGATNNSNFFGEQRGGAIIPFVFGADTIKELQVITNGYDAQYGNAAGAVINAITKSGTNEFQGSALYLVRNDQWMAKAKPTPVEANAGNNSTKALTRVGDSYNMNVNVGGPIIKDKLFYFVGAETYAINRLAVPSFGSPNATVKGDGNDATDYANFLAATNLQNVYTSRSGHTFGQEGTTQFPYMQETKNTSYFARLDYNLTEAQRMSLRVNYNKFKDTIGGGNTIFTPESNELLNTTNAISWVLEHSAIWTPDLFSETRLQVSNERRPFDGNGVSPAISVPGFTAGTKTSTPRQMNEIMTELINNTTWTLGDWALKAGIDLQKISIENQFFNNGNGAISFGSFKAAADWASGVVGTTEPGGIRYNGATSINGGRVHIDTDLNSEYMQGQYQTWSHRLTLTAGLRFTQQKISDNPRPNANLAGLDSAADSTTTDPRFAFALDLDGNAKTVIRGGYGFFSTPTPMLLVANTMTGNGNTIVNYSYNLNAGTQAFFNNAGNGFLSAGQLINGQTFNKVSDTTLMANATNGAGAVQVWDPRTTMARAHKASLGIDHDMGNGWTVGATATYTEFDHLQYLVNINLAQKDAAGNVVAGAYYNDGYPTTINSFSNAAASRPYKAVVDGRTLYFGQGGNPAGANYTPGNPAGGFSDVYLVKGDATGRYRGLTLEMKKVWNADAGVMANITFSSSQDTNSNERGTFTSTGNFPNSELALASTTNPANPRADWANGWADRFAVVNVVAYFPIVWGIKGSTRFNYSTGLPYTALSTQDTNGDGIAFNDPAFGGRNGQRQPDTKVMDLRLTRAWTIYKRYQIETSLDVFNLFNWANQFVSDSNNTAGQIGTLNTGALNPKFGQIDGRDFNTREVQLGFRVRF